MFLTGATDLADADPLLVVDDAAVQANGGWDTRLHGTVSLLNATDSR